MRIYDPRVGRFLSIDPLAKKYPELTPYQYASNTPIGSIDLDGMEGFSLANVQSHLVVQSQQQLAKAAQDYLITKANQPTLGQYNAPQNQFEQRKHDARMAEVLDNAGLNQDGTKKLLTQLSDNKYFQNFANRMALPMVTAYSYLGGLGEEGAAVESFYRTMSEGDFAAFQKTGAIPATGETFISPTAAYSKKFDGVLVRINTKAGTMKQLEEMGVRNIANDHPYGGLPIVQKGWGQNSAFFKFETNGDGIEQINIGLGKGKALQTFNKNITSYQVMSKQ